MSNKYLLFEVNGDPSKDIAGTAVVANLKKKYSDRKIIVATFFPEVWLHHPDVYRIYKLGNTPYFFEDYIENQDTLVFRLDPFLTEDFIYRRRHLIEIWSKLCWAPYEVKKPQLYFTARELEATSKMTKRDKPLFLFETRALLNNPLFDVWKFEPAISAFPAASAMAVVNAYQKAGFHPVHLKRADEAELPKVEWLNLPLRQIMCAIKISSENLFLNSFAMQTATATDSAAAIISSPEDWQTWGYEGLDQISTTSPANIIQKLL